MANTTSPVLPSILDVLENYLGELDSRRIDRLTEAELAELADLVNEFYDSRDVPATDELRMYSGGWIAGNFEAPFARAYLYTTLLYYPQTLIHDPVADWFFPGREQLAAPSPVLGRNGLGIQGTESALLTSDGYFRLISEPERTRAQLKRVLPVFSELADLIRAGVVIPVSQWRLVKPQASRMLTAIRYDVRDSDFVSMVRTPVDEPAPRGDHVRGMGTTPNGGWAPGEEDRGDTQDAAYFLNKTLAISAATNSLYVPPAATDAKLLDIKMQRLDVELRRKNVDLQLAPALANASLPFFDDLDPKTLLAIRRDEAAFADWQHDLRTAVRAVGSRSSEGEAFIAEAREVLNDALLPRVHEVEKLVSKSAVLRSATKGAIADLGLGAGVLVAGAQVAGEAITGVGLATLGISAVGQWLLKPFLRESPTGSKAVLATLIKRRL